MKLSSLFTLTVGFLTFIGSSACLGQSLVSDSLLTVFYDEKQPDSARIAALITLGNGNFRRQYPDSLLALHQDANEMIVSVGKPSDKVVATFQKAQAEYYLFQYLNSLNTVKRCIELAGKQPDTLQLIRAIHLSTRCYTELSDYASAIEQGTEALILAERVGNSRYIAFIRANIGLNYGLYREFDKARTYLERALHLEGEEQNIDGQIRQLTNIGWTYSEEKNHKKSQEYHLKAFALVQQGKTFGVEATVALNLGDTYFNLDNYPLAKQYIQHGYNLAKLNNEKQAIGRGAIQLAHLLRSDMPDSAMYYAQVGLASAEDLGNLVIRENALEILSELYEEKGMPKKALELHKRWKITLDSIFSDRNKRALIDGELKYEYEKQKIKENIELQKDLAAQKLAAQMRFYLLLMGGLITIIGLFFYFRRRSNLQEWERITLMHEMDFLKERVPIDVSFEERDTPRPQFLDRDRLGEFLGNPLGESAWRIVSLIFENPSISNREIAEDLDLSIEGVSTSLRRMYKAFAVRSESNRNLKIALVNKAVKISLNEGQYN